ncbi:hypothetical protein AgCh_017828 [Apium graveolens]
MKRYWKRKQYQRLNRKRKPRIARLGNQRQQVANVSETTKIMLKFFSAVKFFSKFRNGTIASLSDKKLLQDKTDFSTKRRAVPIVSGTNNEVVDARLVLEIYKRLVSTGEVARLLV